MASSTFTHPTLGKLNGIAKGSLLQLRNIPYGSIPQRFGRAGLVEKLPKSCNGQPYDATRLSPASIQPMDSGKMDCKGNQLPADLMDGYEETQSEDCLRLNITMPASNPSTSPLPVLVFVHGGAFFIGSSTRPYYDPTSMCEDAMQQGFPHIFVSLNYRLGGLGFFHSPEAPDLMPENNGLHDQLIAFGWIQRFISGFGGDANNITAMGQSAGGMSVTIHNLSGQPNVWKRSIQFSGSLVTMPVKTPQEHQENFLTQAERFDLDDIANKTSAQIAQEMIDLPDHKLRSAGYVGLPCSSSSLLPYASASMATMSTLQPKSSSSNNLESQIISSTTYDGGISYNLMIESHSRKFHARSFINIVNSSHLSHPQDLLDLYDILPSDDDPTALRKICQFESDIGFFTASLAQAKGFPGKSHLLIFDLRNPFVGLLPARECATHTWDIVALLGACEGRLDAAYKAVVREFRAKVLGYIATGEEPWPAWTAEEGLALLVDKEGCEVVGKDYYMGKDTRRGKLLALAQAEAGEDGADLLWDGVCRRFLMGGT
jgi:carboxylesterase type B